MARAKSAKGTGGMREERGRDANIENHENRFADMERREGCGWEETTWTMQKHPGFGQSASSSEKREFSNDWKVFFQWLEKMGRFFQ